MGLADKVSLTGQGQEQNRMMMDVPDAPLLCPWQFPMMLGGMLHLKDLKSESTEAVWLTLFLHVIVFI